LNGVDGYCGGECCGSRRDSTSNKIGTKVLQRPRDALASGVLIRAKRASDFRQAALFEETEQQRIAVVASKLVERFVEQGTDLFPIGCGFGFENVHGHSLLFTLHATAFGAEQLRGGVTRCAVKPAAQHDAFRQRARLASEVGEDQLRHVLCEVCVTASPP
jgi:hypothetical protein